MRVPLTPRRAWPAGETIVPLPPVTADVGIIRLYASCVGWPVGARVYIALDLLDPDDQSWKAITVIDAVGGAVDRRGVPFTECSSDTRKHRRDNLTVPYFRHVWPKNDQWLLPQLQLRVVSTHAINSLIQGDW